MQGWALSALVGLLVLAPLFVCHAAATVSNAVLGSFPEFEHPYDPVSLYLLYTAFPLDTTEAATVETAGPAFASYTATHCGVGFWDESSGERWSVELEPLSFEGQFMPKAPKGERASWNNQGNVRVRRGLELDSDGSNSAAYWQTSKRIASAAAASVTALEVFLLANVLDLTSDLQPFSVVLANSSQVLLAPKTPFTFTSAVLQQLANQGVVFDVFVPPQMPVLSYSSPSPALPWVPLSPAVAAWFTKLEACFNSVASSVRAQNLGGVAFLGLASRCYGRHAYVFRSADSVFNVSLAQVAAPLLPVPSSPPPTSRSPAPSAAAHPSSQSCTAAVQFSTVRVTLRSFVPVAPQARWRMQDLLLGGLVALVLFTGSALLARFYLRQSMRRRVSLSGETLAGIVIGDLLAAPHADSARRAKLAQYFLGGGKTGAAGRARGCCSCLGALCCCGAYLGRPAAAAAAADGQAQAGQGPSGAGPVLLSPNSRAAAEQAMISAAQRRSQRLAVLQQPSQHQQHHPSQQHQQHQQQAPRRLAPLPTSPIESATPLRPKFPLSRTPNELVATPYVSAAAVRALDTPVADGDGDRDVGGAVTLTPFAAKL